MRKMVLLAAMLALVLLVVAPALSQTDDGSNTDESGIVNNILDLLGGSDEGDGGEGEAVDLGANGDADVDAGVDEDQEGDDAADNDDATDDATDDEEGDDAIDVDVADDEEGNDDGEGDEGRIIDDLQDLLDNATNDDATDDDVADDEEGNDDGEGDEGDIIGDLQDWLDSHKGDDGEGDASDEGDESDITDNLQDLLDSNDGNGAVADEVQDLLDRYDGMDDQRRANRDNGVAVSDGRDDDRDDRNDGGSGEGTESVSAFKQDTNSGDITQTFSVTGPGDNASQCLNISPVANSGNTQNQIGGQLGGGNVEFNDVNAKLDVSGGSTVTCDQPINQAASASGGYSSGY